MARHRVDSATMAELVSELDRIAALSAELIAEASAVEERVGADWSGEAATQYRALQTEWSAGAAEMQSAAQRITDRARTASANYDSAADHSRSIWA